MRRVFLLGLAALCFAVVAITNIMGHDQPWKIAITSVAAITFAALTFKEWRATHA